MIRITQRALEKLKAMREGEKSLRVGITPGGCSGYSYKIGWDDLQDGDNQIEQEGITILYRDEHIPLIYGLEIDYEETLFGGGFTVDNPNAFRSCGCGQSFRPKNDAGSPAVC